MASTAIAAPAAAPLAPTLTANPPGIASPVAPEPVIAPEPVDAVVPHAAPVESASSKPAPTATLSAPSGGFWRRSVALALDLIVFTLVIGSVVDVFAPDPNHFKVKATKTPVEEVEDAPKEPTEETTEISVSSFNVTDDGIHIGGDDGAEVHIDDDGVMIRSADGKEVRFDGGNIHVGPTVGFTLKISLWILYCAIFLTLFGATPGKMVLRLQVVQRGHDPGRMPFIVALTRSAFFILSSFVLGLGCFASLLNRERRTWHDSIARTRVIRVIET